MPEVLKIGFYGYADTSSDYIHSLSKIENVQFEGVFFPDGKPDECEYNGKQFLSFYDMLDGVDGVFFFGEKLRKKIIADSIRELKYVFVDDYDAVLNPDAAYLQQLADEAQVFIQVSMPKMFYWNIQQMLEEYKKIRYVAFIKEYPFTHGRQMLDIVPETLATIKLVDSDVLRAYKKVVPLFTKKFEMTDVRLEFANGATGVINANPCGLADKYELRFVADKAIVNLDLRRREWHTILYKPSTKEVTKELSVLDEVPDVELNEAEDFINAIRNEKEPFVTTRDMIKLYKCFTLMDGEE